jgi:hypothetical protein
MIPNTSALSWPLVAILAAILAGASFLGHDHVLSGEFVASIYAAVVSAVTVGHFSTTNAPPS